MVKGGKYVLFYLFIYYLFIDSLPRVVVQPKLVLHEPYITMITKYQTYKNNTIWKSTHAQ